MKYFLFLPCSLLALGVSATEKAKVAPNPKKPNLLVIMADQWRGRALGFLGAEPVKTPNLDKLAAAGVVLNQAVSGYPVSSPARGMFLTGAYPHVNGVTGNCNSHTSRTDVQLRQDIVCWSDVLKAQDYATGYIGKWHLDKLHEPFVDCANNRGEMAWNEWCEPARRHGFDYWVAYGTYDRHLRPMYWDTDAARDEFYYVNKWGPEYETDLAVDFIASNAEGAKPFAMMVSMNPPHTGYEMVPDRYKKLYKDLDVDSVIRSWPNANGLEAVNANYLKASLADYYACMSGVDDQVGRIMAALEASGQLENTLLIFTSDHGDMMGINNHIGKNIFYEESMRIPMIISQKGRLTPRVDNELLISLEDLYPTMLSLLGLADQVPPSVQTRDLSAQVLGSRKSMPTSQLYIHWTEGDTEIERIYPGNGSRGLRTARYTYSQKALGSKIIAQYLFDRQTDPWELTNIATQKPQVVKKLQTILRKRLKEANDPWLDEVKPN